MSLSARNHLPGTVEQVHRVGENLIESVITRQSVEDLGLAQGDEVRVVVKSTEVMIQKD